MDLADERLRELYGEYMGSISVLDELNSQKLTATTELAGLEEGFYLFLKLRKILILLGRKKNIANYNFQIGLYEKYEKVDKNRITTKRLPHCIKSGRK